MLSSNRMTPTRSHKPDEDTELWESLRVEAVRRSSEFPAARSLPPPPPPRASHYPARASSGASSPFSVAFPGPTSTGSQEIYELSEYEEVQPEAPVRSAYAAQTPSPGALSMPPAFDANAWARTFEAPAIESIEASAPRARSRWLVPAVALASLLGIGAASYQLVLLPRQAQERAAALAALEVQQQKLLEEQRALEEANARADAEQRAAEEATRRAEQAAEEAAHADPSGGKSSKLAVADRSQDDAVHTRGSSAREDRKARRAARRARRHQRRAERAASQESSRSSSKKSTRNADGAESDDPLFGL